MIIDYKNEDIIKNKDIKKLAIRKWTCPECGTVHDRDINAAKNILNKALSVPTAGTAEC